MINLLKKTFILILFLFSSCFTEQKKFTKEKWSEWGDVTYPQRKKIVKDLITNHLTNDMCYMHLINLLGKTSPIDLKSNAIYFEIEEKYSQDIDPVWIKYLEIELNTDSCFHKARVIKI